MWFGIKKCGVAESVGVMIISAVYASCCRQMAWLKGLCRQLIFDVFIAALLPHSLLPSLDPRSNNPAPLNCRNAMSSFKVEFQDYLGCFIGIFEICFSGLMLFILLASKLACGILCFSPILERSLPLLPFPFVMRYSFTSPPPRPMQPSKGSAIYPSIPLMRRVAWL